LLLLEAAEASSSWCSIRNAIIVNIIAMMMMMMMMMMYCSVVTTYGKWIYILIASIPSLLLGGTVIVFVVHTAVNSG
jgi:hypothetical protein